MEKKKEHSLGFIAFFQALGIILYCSLIALLILQGNKWFGNMPNYFGPFLFLVLFSTSALICAIITLSYPFILWQKKQLLDQAIKLIIYTAGWLLFFTLYLMIFIFLFR